MLLLARKVALHKEILKCADYCGASSSALLSSDRQNTAILDILEQPWDIFTSGYNTSKTLITGSGWGEEPAANRRVSPTE